MNPRPPVNNATLIAFKHLCVLLNKGVYSKRELAELTGMGHVTICRWVSGLHRGPDNCIYIAQRKLLSTQGPYTAYFTWGYRMPDVPTPIRRTKKVNARAQLIRSQIKQTEKGLIHVSR